MLCKILLATIFVVALIMNTCVNGANILFLNGITSPSHHFWNLAITNGLAARGHNVTALSVDVEKKSSVHYIHIEGLYNENYHAIVQAMVDFRKNMNPWTASAEFNSFFTGCCQASIQSKGFRTLLEYPDDFRFDVIIHDFTPGPCLLGFVHKFKNPPLVAVSAYSHPSYLSAIIGDHGHPAYIPHNFIPRDDDMNILDRLYNFAIHTVEYVHWKLVYTPNLDKMVEGIYGPGLPPLNEIESRAAITLVNTNPAFDYLAPLPENVVAVGGLQVRDSKPLPKDLEEFIVSAKKGAVLFSLGSNIRASAIDINKLKIFIDAFAQFPDYHFMWKFEESTIAIKLPKNVIIRKWLPQSDILAHPKIKAFVTHSGTLSTHEAIWRGVPLLSVPFGYDQDINFLKCKRYGFAEGVDFHTTTTQDVQDKLQKLLEDPKYMENAKKISARFRDQKELPLDRAIWYIEWVLRNPDSSYLKSPVLRLGIIAGNSFDVVAIISITLTVAIYAIIKICLPAPKKYVLNTGTGKHKKTQ